METADLLLPALRNLDVNALDPDSTGNPLHKTAQTICYKFLPSADVLVCFFPSKFFLMERAGRRKLLLTGFICIAVCNLLTTIADSVLVGSARNPRLVLFLPPSFECNVTLACRHAAPGARAAQPAGPAGFLPDLRL